jgi:transcriptional regulator with XRE-family HTH domain
MVRGDRLRELREQKNLSQGDIEKRTGLVRCYISRVENEHTVPAVATLERLARAFDVPMYQLFYSTKAMPAQAADLLTRKSSDETAAWGSSGKDAKFLRNPAEFSFATRFVFGSEYRDRRGRRDAHRRWWKGPLKNRRRYRRRNSGEKRREPSMRLAGPDDSLQS